MLNARRRHDRLLRQYLVVTRERAEAQLGGAPSSRIDRLGVRERALAAAVRNVRLYLGLSGTFDPELESARLGLDGKRPAGSGKGPALTAPAGLRPRIAPVPRSASVAGDERDQPPGRVDGAKSVVTVSDLLDFLGSHAIHPDAPILVRRAPDRTGASVAAIGLTDDGRIQLESR